MRTLLLLTVTCTGAAVMIVEMTAVRALQPYFGSTTWVWANVIAVVLASLAAGYAVGGRLADRVPSPRLVFGLLAGGGLLLVLAAGLVRPIADLFLTRETDLEGVTTVFVKGSLGATLILFAPATLLLGMISPIAIHLLADRGVGRAAGSVFALSTVGSIAGTYLPVVVLVPHLGSRGSLLTAAGLLLLPAAVGLLASRRPRSALAILLLTGATGALALTLAGAPARPAPELSGGIRSTVLRELESEYQFLTVREDRLPDGTIHDVLTVNEGIRAGQSMRVRGRVLTGSRYYDDYTLLPLLLDVPLGEELRGCIVGLACGIMAIQWRHFWDGPYRLRVDGAEIDPRVIALGREFFGLPGPEKEWLRVFEMDGRRMLATLPGDRTYHMLVVDAFANELYLPFHLGTIEFFELCRERLAPGGILALNVNAYSPDSPNLEALAQTLSTAFGHCYLIRQRGGGNFILLARRGSTPPDFTRLAAARIRERFGDRRDTAEWDELVARAHRVPAHTTRVSPREGSPVLTDDHAPLERLTDRFLRRFESEVLR